MNASLFSLRQRLLTTFLCSFAALLGPGTSPLFAQDEEEAELPLEVRVYSVADIVVAPPSYPFRGAQIPGATLRRSGNSPFSMGIGGYGGGGFGGGGGGFGGGAGGAFSVPSQVNPQVSTPTPQPQTAPLGGMGGAPDQTQTFLTISPNDLIDTITTAISPDTWDEVGGSGNVNFIGGMLIVNQTAPVHEGIETLLKQIRQSAPVQRTMTIRAWWLLVKSQEITKVAPNGQADVAALEALAAASPGFEGQITCFNGQTVYIVAGKANSVVTSAIPVVGSGIGYHPQVDFPLAGGMLQITPLLIGGEDSALLDVQSVVTHVSKGGDPVKFESFVPTEAEGHEAAGPLVVSAQSYDRVNVYVQELVTSVRVVLGKPTLVGGLTQEPASQEGTAADARQLYLIVQCTPAVE